MELLGVTREEYALFQTDIFKFFAEDKDRKAYINMLEEAILTNSDASCEIECNDIHGGEFFWLEVRCRLLATNVNRHIFYCNVEDITCRKQLEQKNLALNEELLSLMDSVPGGIIRFEISDGVHTLAFVNKRAADIYGLPMNEIYDSFASRPFGFIHPDDREAAQKRFASAIRRGFSSIDLECRRLTPDGSIIWIYLKARLIKKQTGATFVTAIIMDVSDKKAAEQAAYERDMQLKKQYALQQSLFSTIECGIMQYSLNNDSRSLLNFNDKVWQLFGYRSRADYVTSTIGKSKVLDTHPDDLALVSEKIAAISGPADNLAFDHRIICKDGTVKWVHTTLEKVIMPDGSKIIQAVFSDISDQIQKEYDKYYKTVLSFFDEVYEVDGKDNTIILRSSITQRDDLLNRTLDFAKSMDSWINGCVVPADRALVRHFCDGCAGQNPSIEQIEYRIGNQAGDIVWISSKRLHIFDERYFICNQDITVQKQREDIDKQSALLTAINREKRAEEEQSRLIAQISNGMLFSYDCATRIMDFTARSVSGEYLTLSANDFLETGLNEDLFIHPDDRPLLRNAFAAAAAGRTVSAFDFRSDFGSDDYRLWRINYTSIEDDCGSIYRIIG